MIDIKHFTIWIISKGAYYDRREILRWYGHEFWLLEPCIIEKQFRLYRGQGGKVLVNCYECKLKINRYEKRD